MSVSVPIEIDREDDGRWVAGIPDLPGVMCYGNSRDEAFARVQALAHRVLPERFDLIVITHGHRDHRAAAERKLTLRATPNSRAIAWLPPPPPASAGPFADRLSRFGGHLRNHRSALPMNREHGGA
jgi:predicted RNase H-like HicB family nuclease